MTRKRIQIKKIDDISSRQVTFSKRRKGLFKKAQELSTLCDADMALIVFSATSKLFEYASSSMQQVIERLDRHSAIHRLNRPSILQADSDSNDMLRKKVEDKTRELSQLNGQELQGLTLQELQKVEELLKRGLTSVSKVKDEKFRREISTLKRKYPLSASMLIIYIAHAGSGTDGRKQKIETGTEPYTWTKAIISIHHSKFILSS